MQLLILGVIAIVIFILEECLFTASEVTPRDWTTISGVLL